MIDVEAGITATATSINGSFHSKGTTTASGGAPTGGSEHVSSTINVTSGGASQAYTADFDVTFPSN